MTQKFLQAVIKSHKMWKSLNMRREKLEVIAPHTFPDLQGTFFKQINNISTRKWTLCKNQMKH